MLATRLILLAGALWALCWSTPLYANETDAAAAEALFQEGRAAMAQKEYDRACLNFQESLRLQSAVGTVMNLATCEEKRGKFASSWERWQQALRLLEPGDRRRDFAKQRSDAMAGRVSRLSVSPHAKWKSKIVITSGGVRLGAASYGRPLPVDQGERVISVAAPGYSPRTYRVVLKPGEEQALLVEPGPRIQPSESSASGSRQTQKVFAFVATGVGALGLGTAIVTAALLPGMQATVDDNCPAQRCNQDGLNAASAGQAALTANTVGWITAGVGLATAGVLFLTLPDDGDHKAQKVGLNVNPGGASLQLQGNF